jgi:hypothetical protein
MAVNWNNTKGQWSKLDTITVYSLATKLTLSEHNFLQNTLKVYEFDCHCGLEVGVPGYV